MSNEPTSTAVNSRLRALCDIVISEAARNPQFLAALEEVLLSPEAKVKIQSRKSKSSRPSINTVQILQQSGESGLSEALSRLTTDDIRKIITADRHARIKNLREKDRETLVALLIERTRKRLNQGLVFIKTG